MLLLFFSLSFCILLNALITERIILDKEGFFVKESSPGHRILFHGFNSVRKYTPFYDTNVFNLTRQKLYTQWGFNVVRLGIIWNAMYPSKGRYNKTYLDEIERQVNVFSSHGIYVLLEWHQDVLSKRFGTYDSIPNWLLDDFGRSSWVFRHPWPFKKIEPNDWFLNYLTYESSQAAQNIYDNYKNALNYLGDFWELIADRFAANKAVLGYELINEPWCGQMFKNPLYVMSGE